MYCIMNTGVQTVLGSQGTVREYMFQNIMYKKIMDNLNVHGSSHHGYMVLENPEQVPKNYCALHQSGTTSFGNFQMVFRLEKTPNGLRAHCGICGMNQIA